MIGWRKRFGAAAVLAAVAAAVLGLSVWAGIAVVTLAKHTIASPPIAPVIAAIQRPAPAYTTAASVPVLVYHEMNNHCPPTAVTCKAKDPETVSTAQFTAEMAWLVKAGYRTISLAQYEAWLRNPAIRLPARPILLTADNGIGSFLQGAQPILERDGFTANAFLVTGFADGAAGHCQPPMAVNSAKAGLAEAAGARYDVQPRCGSSNKGWDLTWPQLRALSPRAWSFALEAGPSGHFVQDYTPRCKMFDACKLPGETTASYEARVRGELGTGLDDLGVNLPGRVNRDAWVVPYSDLGYHRCVQAGCTPQDSTGPAGWLARYAQSRFGAVFVEDAFRNGVQGERFRMDVNGGYSLPVFAHLLGSFTAAGDFARTHHHPTPPPPPGPLGGPVQAAPAGAVAAATSKPPATHPAVTPPAPSPSPAVTRTHRPRPSPSPSLTVSPRPSLTTTPPQSPSPSGSGS